MNAHASTPDISVGAAPAAAAVPDARAALPPGTDGAAVGMQVLVRMGRMHDRGLDIVRADVHDMGFGVVEPDGGVEMGHAELSCGWWTQLTPATRSGP